MSVNGVKEDDTKQVTLPISFGPVNENNVGQLRKLNTSIFPVRYNDKFYTDILTTPEEYTKFAFYNGLVIGAICCRLETSKEGKKSIYIMTLGVLSAYRGNGVGKRLLQSVLRAAEKDPQIEEVYLHVQTSNDEAIHFYEKFDFHVTETIKNYYKRIDPPDCYVLKKILAPKN